MESKGNLALFFEITTNKLRRGWCRGTPNPQKPPVHDI